MTAKRAKFFSFDTPASASETADGFLRDEPVLNNLMLTLLAARIAQPQPGQYWVGQAKGEVNGFALQSPLKFPLNLSVMTPEVAADLAEAIAAEAHDLPGVFGEARLAARFAGQWAELRGIGAHPTTAQRLYSAGVIRPGLSAPGALEQAGSGERPLLCEWTTAFSREVGGLIDNIEAFVERRVASGQFWFWRDHDLKAMAAHTEAIAGVTRIQAVYTPAQFRRKGYGEALARTLTGHLLGAGLCPILYADLGNPTSNAIYRRVGYEPVGEFVRYRFGTAEG
jgi:uncharacterized protein